MNETIFTTSEKFAIVEAAELARLKAIEKAAREMKERLTALRNVQKGVMDCDNI